MTGSIPLGQLIKPAANRKAGDGEFPVLSMTMHEGLVDQRTKFKKRVASADTSGYRLVERGQLVVGFPIDEGVLSFQDAYEEAIVSPAYGIWDLRDRHPTHRPYLERYLRSPWAIRYYEAKLRGSTARRRSLPREVFLEMPIPLPPIGRQRRIAAVLDAADALRAKRRQAIARLDTLIQAIFIDMFGDLSRYERVPFGSLLTQPMRNGISPSKSGSVVAEVLTLSAITGAVFDSGATKESTFTRSHIASKTVSTSDFLICRGNGNLGLVGRGKRPDRNRPEVAFPDTMIAARCDPDKVSPGYLDHLWDGPLVRRQLEGLARTTNGTYKVNQSMIESVLVPLPDLAAQLQFGGVRGAIDSHRRTSRRSEAELNTLFASLQQRAFRGEP